MRWQPAQVHGVKIVKIANAGHVYRESYDRDIKKPSSIPFNHPCHSRIIRTDLSLSLFPDRAYLMMNELTTRPF